MSSNVATRPTLSTAVLARSDLAQRGHPARRRRPPGGALGAGHLPPAEHPGPDLGTDVRRAARRLGLRRLARARDDRRSTSPSASSACRCSRAARRAGSRSPGATGGYLVGMLVAAGFVGYLAERGLDRKLSSAVASMLTGNVVIYAVRPRLAVPRAAARHVLVDAERRPVPVRGGRPAEDLPRGRAASGRLVARQARARDRLLRRPEAARPEASRAPAASASPSVARLDGLARQRVRERRRRVVRQRHRGLAPDIAADRGDADVDERRRPPRHRRRSPSDPGSAVRTRSRGALPARSPTAAGTRRSRRRRAARAGDGAPAPSRAA